MIQASAQTTYIHMGTAIDLLNGITVTWNGQGIADSIKWGYTPSFEKEQFRVDCGLKGQGKNLTDQQAHEILEFLRANDKDTTSRFH
jgi:hypothetical protein